jgi:TonB-dependent receptor
MQWSAQRIILRLALALAVWERPGEGMAKGCDGSSLSAAVLAVARRSSLQVVFNPDVMRDRCAPTQAPFSTRPEQDLASLARAAGLQVVEIKPGMITLTPLEPRSATSGRIPAAGEHQPLRPKADIGEVIVTARQAQGSLFEKRYTVAETSAISADEIARRPVSNIVDAVSVLPGVSVYADMGLGQAATGDPEFITVRGIDSSNDVYELNGARVPESDPDSRALSLKMLPPFGLQSVQIIKSPTADYDGDSIGGVVNIRMPTGFDFAKGLTQVTVRGNLDDLAEQKGFNSLGAAVQLEFARRVLDDRFAFYITGFFQKTNSVGESGEVGAWVPTLSSQSGLTNFRQVTGGLSANEYKWDFYTNEITNYGGVAALDYRTGAQSLYVRLTASEYDDRGVDSQFSLRQRLADTGTNAVGQVVDAFGNPVGKGLPGIPAYAPQQTSQNPGGGLYDAAGLYNPNGVMAGSYFQTRDQIDELYTLKVGGASTLDRLTLSYESSYGFSRQARPDYVEGSSYGMPLADARFQINWANGYTPNFALTAGQQAYLFNQANTALWKLQGQDSASADNLYGGKIDADYRLGDGFINILHAGLDISDAYRNQYSHNFTGEDSGNFEILTPQGYAPPIYAAAGPTLNNQPGRNISGSFLNFPGLFRTLSRGAYTGYILPYAYQSDFAINPATGTATIGNPGVYTINDYNAGTAYSTEIISAAYVSADLKLGHLGIYPGLRYENTDFNASYWDAAKTGFDQVARSYGNLLPSLNFVYRSDDGLVCRAAVRQGFSRPPIGLVASPPAITVDSGTGDVTAIQYSNPNLKPMTSVNYDASIEYYGAHGALMELSIYRKTLSHVIYGAQVTGGPPQANAISTVVDGVTYSQWVNGGHGYLNGLEIDAQERFVDLPAPFDGLGVSANATIQHGEADSGLADHFGRLTWLPRAPELIYNLEASYASSRFWADLTYQYTGLQLENLTGDNLDNFLQPTRFLSLKLGTSMGGVKWSLAGKNLLDSPIFWKTLGPSTRYLGVQDGDGNGSYVVTGRVFSLTATKTW